MKNLLRLLSPIVRPAFVVALLALVATQPAFSQGSSPLDAPVYRYVGVMGGISSITQNGIWRSGCGEFDEGSGIAPIIAVATDASISGEFLRYEVMLGFQQRNIGSSLRVDAMTPIATENGVATALVQFEDHGTLTSSSFFLLPSIKFSILPWLYVGAGASAGLTLSTTTSYSREILSRTVEIGSTLEEISFDESESSDRYVRTLPEENRDDASTLMLEGVAYLGADFQVSDGWTAGPRFSYTIPLTPLFDDPSLELQSMQFLVGIRRVLR